MTSSDTLLPESSMPGRRGVVTEINKKKEINHQGQTPQCNERER